MSAYLFITNGHGEDAVAVQMIREVKKQQSNAEILAYPLIGKGERFEKEGLKVLGPRRDMPSGGFIHHNLGGLLMDILKGGLIWNGISHCRNLRALRGKAKKVIAIGDMIPVFAASIVGAQTVHVGINKSDYYKFLGYTYMGFEVAYLRSYIEQVFVRDAITAERLKKKGVRALYVGNPMMDGMPAQHSSLSKNPPTIGFLPGTRAKDIQKNLEDFDKIAGSVLSARSDITCLVAYPRNDTHPTLTHTVSFASFDEVLSRSDMIVGLSGTGNEQAAGCGIPIVAFPSRGEQYSLRYGKAQQQLLGEAVALVPRDPDQICREIFEILDSPDRYRRMSEVGRERMGTSGASARIAQEITHV